MTSINAQAVAATELKPLRNDLSEAYSSTIGNDTPVEFVVTHYYKQLPFTGSAWQCDSDSDYYGYTEFEYDLYDEFGFERDDWKASVVTREDELRFLHEYESQIFDDDYY